MKKIDIIGTGQSMASYDWSRGVEKWSVGTASSNYVEHIDLYFCMHEKQTCKYNYVDLKSYPIKEIIYRYNTDYFTSTISYMIAYALHLGYQEINLFGIDMTIQSEYEYERPCVLYWIGKAESLGIKVNNMSNYGFFMYGYDSQKLNKLTESLTSKLVYATNKIKEKDISNDEKNQWIGQAYTLKQILREIKS